MAGFCVTFRCFAAAIGLGALICVLPLAGVRSAAAYQDDSASFLTPFPDGDVYRLWVVGDWFADGVLDGLVESFGTDTRLDISRKVLRFSGIMRNSFDTKATALEQEVTPEPIDIFVVMTGESDQISIRDDSGRRLPVASPQWVAEYQKRVGRLMKILKRKKAGVYWVGLPNYSRVGANEQAQVMNETIRERAYLNGFKYIDATVGFTDENGNYSAYGPDLEGKIRVLRSRDGVHFTAAGNRKLAHFVEKEIRRDLNQAKRSRDVPLLGAEAEQALINPDNTNSAPAPKSPVKAKAADDAATPLVKAEDASGPAAATPVVRRGAVDASADNGSIALEVVGANGTVAKKQIAIIRPAIPASVVALMARRERRGQPGDLLVDQIGGGVTLMTSVSPSGQQGRGRLAPTQAPYFRLLVKGERLQPKPGRADDIEWPLQQDDTSEAPAKADAPKG